MISGLPRVVFFYPARKMMFFLHYKSMMHHTRCMKVCYYRDHSSIRKEEKKKLRENNRTQISHSAHEEQGVRWFLPWQIKPGCSDACALAWSALQGKHLPLYAATRD